MRILKWFKRRLWPSMNGEAGFEGKLTAKVIRIRPTLWQRFIDFLKGNT